MVNGADSDGVTFHIIPDDLSDSVNRSFRCGYFANVTGVNYHTRTIIVFTKKQSVKLDSVDSNGNKVTSASTITLSYR